MSAHPLKRRVAKQTKKSHTFFEVQDNLRDYENSLKDAAAEHKKIQNEEESTVYSAEERLFMR